MAEGWQNGRRKSKYLRDRKIGLMEWLARQNRFSIDWLPVLMPTGIPASEIEPPNAMLFDGKIFRDGDRR